jgi:hypothetical protein
VGMWSREGCSGSGTDLHRPAKAFGLAGLNPQMSDFDCHASNLESIRGAD